MRLPRYQIQSGAEGGGQKIELEWTTKNSEGKKENLQKVDERIEKGPEILA